MCAEPRAISNFVFEAEKLLGIKKGTMTLEQAQEVLTESVSKTKGIVNKKSGKLTHKVHKDACPTCNPLLRYFGILEDITSK